MQEETYNGWANRETWLTNMWLTADPSGVVLIEEAQDQEDDIYRQAEWLAERVCDKLGLGGETGLKADLLRTSLRAVDWVNIIQDN